MSQIQDIKNRLEECKAKADGNFRVFKATAEVCAAMQEAATDRPSLRDTLNALRQHLQETDLQETGKAAARVSVFVPVKPSSMLIG